MAGKLVVLVKMPTVAGKYREQLMERMLINERDIQKNEPGVLKYAACVPREDDGKTLWIIEEYKDQEAFDVHLAGEMVKKTMEWFQSTPEAFAEDNPAVIYRLQYISDELEFTRPESASDKHQDPHIIFSELDYSPGGVEEAIPYWKAVVEAGRHKEPGTLAYGVLRDLEKQERLATLEVYARPKYLKEVHVLSDAISESIKHTQHLRTGLKHHLLKKVAGFLYRG